MFEGDKSSITVTINGAPAGPVTNVPTLDMFGKVILMMLSALIGLVSILASAGSTRQQLLSSGVEVDPVPGIVLAAVVFLSFGAAYFFVLITLARRGRDFM